VDATTRLRPGNRLRGAGVDLLEACADLGRPPSFRVRIDFSIEALNLGVAATGRVVFTYLITGPDSHALGRFVQRHADLFRATPKWTLRVSGTPSSTSSHYTSITTGDGASLSRFKPHNSTASAANASGFVQTALSRVTRRTVAGLVRPICAASLSIQSYRL
jgi:hypothetical protein